MRFVWRIFIITLWEKKRKMSITPFFILGILIMTFCNSLGAYFFKLTMNEVKVFSLKATFTNIWLYVGSFAYFCGSIFNILLMRDYDYSIVYPLTSISCVWTLLISVIFLNEKINAWKIIAIALIVLGACLICM